MNKKQNEKANRAIAKFMGYKYKYDHDMDWQTCGESWEWIMPVVERIWQLGFTFEVSKPVVIKQRHHQFPFKNIELNVYRDAYPGKMIDATREAILQFITWYDKNKQLIEI